MSNGLKLALGLGRGRPGEPPALSVNLTGFSTDSLGNYAEVGETIGFTSNATPDAVIWSNENPVGMDKSGADPTYGTGDNPTAFTTGTLFLHAQKGSFWTTRSLPIRYTPGTAPSISDQDWTVDDTSVDLAGAATGTGLTFTYEATGLPAGVTINASTGQITGTPSEVGFGTVNVIPTDQYGRTVAYSFGYTNALRAQATAANGISAQNWTVDDTSVNLNVGADFTANGNTLAYSATGLPAGTSINSGTGVITGTPTAVASGSIVVTAQDEYGRQTTSTFTFSSALRAAPTAANGITAQNWTADDTAVNLDVGAQFTTNGNTLTYTATGLPSGVTINSSTGVLTGSPTNASSGSIVVTGTDEYGRTATSTFSYTAVLRAIATATNDTQDWTILEPITPYDITQNFTLNGNSGSFGVTGLPAGLSVSGGNIVGTPEGASVGGTIVITFTDTYGRTTTSEIDYTVTEDTVEVPDLSTVTADAEAGTFSFTVDVACRIYWMRYTGDAPNAATIIAGGGIDSGSFDVVLGPNDVEIEFATGDDGEQFIAFVARIEPDGTPSTVRTVAIDVDTSDAPPADWDIVDNGNGTFSILDAPATPAALTATDNADGTFDLEE